MHSAVYFMGNPRHEELPVTHFQLEASTFRWPSVMPRIRCTSLMITHLPDSLRQAPQGIDLLSIV